MTEENAPIDPAIARSHNTARDQLEVRGFRMYRRFPDGDICVESWRHGRDEVPGVLLYCHYGGWDIYLQLEGATDPAHTGRSAWEALDAHRAAGGW